MRCVLCAPIALRPSDRRLLPDFEWVTTLNGEIPTPGNCSPLLRPEGGGNGRGSMVWYNQATMFQTAELGAPTIKHLLDQQKRTSSGFTVIRCPTKEMIQDGFFPS